ncbi:ATP-dependent RNA helicase [Aquisalimonas sp. 2447]|uniref:helicase-related protein n=1 Tax=Aquisalimonas sp. 2447 TaxID=2740807 RepID=UPI00143268F9|nr:helicase-related protein [Aquisalimonas sp. 2447]QIT54309.1 ATP-dependent RNA helicase [Aquisalimonas sp. 2447]
MRFSELPIDTLRDDFERALDAGHVVVTAATGTGKSTRLPLWAARSGRVLVVEPRRVAAVSLALRIAEESGERAGERIGYAVRLDTRHGPETEICFVTPGIALNWLAESGLSQFATVVLDEFHERRWDTDLLLALLQARGQHRLVLTSATVDGERLASFLHGHHLEAPGQGHPVTVHHLAEGPREMPASKDLAARMAAAVQRALQETDGDVLAFLPGRGEIRATAQQLDGIDADVVPLHGSASIREQERALRSGGRRRAVLATNVAETSLTVPGVTAVVDSGLERRTAQRNGRTVLTLQPIARANADQRRGRAGRTQPGVCLRLWGSQAPLQAAAPPETQREDLADLVLAAAVSDTPVMTLTFPDPPRAQSLERAERALTAMGALDAAGQATALGRRLFALPVDTQFAALILAMPDQDTAGFMADLAAGLHAGPALATVTGDPDDRERLQKMLRRRCDATLRVAALRGLDLPGVTVGRRARDEALALAEHLREQLGLPAVPGDLDPGIIEQALAAAAGSAPVMAFVRREKRREALGNGHGELFPGRESLFGEADEAAMVFDDLSVPGRGTRQTITVATCMAPIPLKTLIDQGLAEVDIDNPTLRKGQLLCTQTWRYAGRALRTEELEPSGAEARRAATELILQGRLLKPAGRRLKDDVQAWEIYQALNALNEPAPEPRQWLQERLTALGVEDAQDLELLSAEDLRFPGIPEWERERFDERYPRHWSLRDLELAIHYDVARKRITAEQVGGSARKPPERWQLPAWPGWRIYFRKASREVEIR